MMKITGKKQQILDALCNEYWMRACNRFWMMECYKYWMENGMVFGCSGGIWALEGDLEMAVAKG